MKTAKEMFDALKKLFESKNTNGAIALKHQLQNIKMTKGKYRCHLLHENC
jgi:hypothetical protein